MPRLPCRASPASEARDGGVAQQDPTRDRWQRRPSPQGRVRKRRRSSRLPRLGRKSPHLLREIRLSGVRLHHSGNRAAAVLVQQSVRRLPEMRRARRRAAHRCRPGHSRPGAHAAPRRHRAVGEILFALLRADAASVRQALPLHARHQMEGSAEEDAGGDPVRLERHRNPLFLRRRDPRLRDAPRLRRRRHQSRAPLPRDRQRLGARGDRPLFHRRAVRGLQWLPAQARGLVRQGWRPAYRRSLRYVGQRRSGLVH